MKYIKTILSLLLMVLLTACQSTEDMAKSMITREEAEMAIEVLYKDSIALTREDFNLDSDDVSQLFPSALEAYRERLARFDVLYDNAATALADLLNDAVKNTLPVLDSYDYSLENPNQSLVESNLFSSNRIQIINLTRPGILSYIRNHGKSFEAAYNELIFECSVLRANYENLENVGITSPLKEIGQFNYGQAASFAADRLYGSLYQSEIRLRNMPLSQQDNDIYRYFWEEL